MAVLFKFNKFLKIGLFLAASALYLILNQFFNSTRPSGNIKLYINNTNRLPGHQIKYISEDGVYPLPKRTIRLNKWTKQSVIPKKFFRNIPNVSRHNFEWLLNPVGTCITSQNNGVIAGGFEDIFLVVVIASASWEFERRDLIRKTWASAKNLFNKEIRYVFFLGQGRSSSEKILQEFRKHEDIVQESYMEAYKNLTLKTQGQLKWATYFCPNARYVMHVDDDVFVDVKRVVQHLLSLRETRSLICGKIFMPKVRRDGKWKMTPEEYRGNQYPKSCVGWCFAMSQSVVNELYFTSINTVLIHLEDVTFTGILREKISGLELQKFPDQQVCQHVGWPKDKPTNEKLLNAWLELNKNG